MTPRTTEMVWINFELNSNFSRIIKFSMYLLKMWNPTNVLDHVANVMTYVRKLKMRVNMVLSLILLPRMLPVLSETAAVKRDGPIDWIT